MQVARERRAKGVFSYIDADVSDPFVIRPPIV